MIEINCNNHEYNTVVFQPLKQDKDVNDVIPCPNGCGKKIRIRISKANGITGLTNIEHAYNVNVSECINGA
jgi:ketol-acid reductoisomerase